MPEPQPAPATSFAVAMLTALVERGLQHVVLSPGSRSQSLALVCAELERIGAIRLHVRIDERVAGFLALGLAIESGLPAVVITTSGTATANLLPAVLEAHHSNVPMLVLTADRPSELRGIRANQTTRQPDLYGFAARLSEDVPAPEGGASERATAIELAAKAMDVAVGCRNGRPGPVHLNLAFREPLSSPAPDLTPWWEQFSAVPELDPTVPELVEGPERATVIEAHPGTIVVAGAGAGPGAEEFARAGGWPLIAEVSSGAHFGPNLIVGYRELLADADFGHLVQRVIVFGHPTLSREVPQLISSGQVQTIVVTGRAYAPSATTDTSDPASTLDSSHAAAQLDHYNPGRAVQRFEPAVVAGVPVVSDESRAWLGRWVSASRRVLEAQERSEQAPVDIEAARATTISARAAFAKQEVAVLRQPVTRRLLVDALWRVTWPHDRLVVAASRLIRVMDRSVPGKRISVHSNRGLAGIDGTIATALGIALASEARADSAGGGVTRVLVGDLALLHDAGALLFGEGERMPRIQVIVGNDGGGTIFDALEVASTASQEALDRVLLTPQRFDLAALAEGYGWEYVRAETRSDLERALTATVAGPTVIEVPLPR